MNERRVTVWVVCLLVLLGIGGTLLRAYLRHELRMAHGDSLWRVKYAVDFVAAKRGAMVHLAYPGDTQHSRVFRQEIYHRGLISDQQRYARRAIHELALTTEREGPLHITAQFDIHISPESRWSLSPAPEVLSAAAISNLLLRTQTLPANSPEIAATLHRITTGKSPPDDVVKAIFDYCVTEIAEGSEGDPEEAADVLEKKVAGPGGKARTLIALCQAAKIPARLVAGFLMMQDEGAHPHIWAEVLQNSRWQPYDPEEGFAHDLPAHFVPLRHDTTNIVWGSDIRDLKTAFTIAALPPPPGVFVPGRRTLLEILDLTRLPLETHQVVALILLIPLGALVTVLFRTVIGLRTFGTFTPTLLALSFVYSDWRTGLFVFAVVMVLGLLSRNLLDRIKLLVVPRLSVILTIVVLTLVFCISLMDYTQLTPTPQAVLLPMVILTMTIERFFINAEEDGFHNAFRMFLLTLLVAFCCYLVLRWNAVGRLLLAYPEIHLITIAILILLGRYTGYRLTEAWRFRDLRETPAQGTGPS